MDRGVDDYLEVQESGVGRGPVIACQQLTGQSAALSYGPLHRFGTTVQCMARTEAVEQQLSANGDGREEVIEIVRHHARQPADRPHLLGLAGLLGRSARGAEPGA